MEGRRRLRPRNRPPPSPIDEESKGDSPPPSPRSPTDASTSRVGANETNTDVRHKAVRGDRYAVPKSEFFEDASPDVLLYGVVVERVRAHTNIWFKGDQRGSMYPGYLEEWSEYYLHPEDYKEDDEEMFQNLERTAGLRKPPRSRAGKRAIESESDGSASEYDEGDEDESSDEGDGEHAPREVETWEEDDVDDESEEPPDADPEDEEEHNVDDVLAGLTWSDAGSLSQDPRARTDSMPANIAPQFLMPDYRNADLLDWFHFWCSPGLIDEIVSATNEKAKSIAWPLNAPWKHLKRGEFHRWLGIWVLMTVYPVADSNRRSYWGSSMEMGKYMSRNRFENILRAFCLPQYTKEDPGWGGQGRQEYEKIKFDKFFATRKFTDVMRKRFNAAIKPGGWIVIDECMFSWLGQALKMAGWKVIKRKPHPFGLESKTAACAATGLIIDFEFQEGKEYMRHFEYVKDYNKSTAWLLRLTKHWANQERRTVIADAAFGQVRAAVALHKEHGMYMIGNVKQCHKWFPKKRLKEETPAYSANNLVCHTLQANVRLSRNESLKVYGTGWRATGKMVCTYVHTGGTNVTGSDRKKRKFVQLSDGNVRTDAYRVKRPKVSSEYQDMMGAIDAHNYRRQSGKGARALEDVCVTNDAKDRVFINTIAWVTVNMFLAKKQFVWGGVERQTSAEFQAAVAQCLINNQHYREEVEFASTSSASTVDELRNDPADCVRNPHGKANKCRVCGQRRTVWVCRKCSRPKPMRNRRDLKGNGQPKTHNAGFLHFCRKVCFANHVCGQVPFRKKRRPALRPHAV